MPNRKRNRAVTIRLTETEYDKFTAAYRKCSDFDSQGEFVMSLLGKKPIIVVNDFRDMLIELKCQGNNLNQLARSFHQGYVDENAAIGVLRNCNNAYERIIDLCECIPEKIGKESKNAAA